MYLQSHRRRPLVNQHYHVNGHLVNSTYIPGIQNLRQYTACQPIGHQQLHAKETYKQITLMYVNVNKNGAKSLHNRLNHG